jgi:hypothetical protein
VVIKIPKFEMLFYEDKEASFVTMSGQDWPQPGPSTYLLSFSPTIRPICADASAERVSIAEPARFSVLRNA